MLKALKSLFGKGGLPQVLSPEEEQKVLKKGSVSERRELAGRKDARPEVLYFLAEDEDASVRREIAANPSTPVQADEKLSQDVDDQVRAELARKIARIVPGLGDGEQKALFDKTIGVLEALAQDQLGKVRALVADEIKASDTVPKSIVDKLARDIEDIVALPILEYSPLLNDDDLREIIAAGSTSARLKAIAGREGVSEAVADDLTATLDIPAIAALLTNDSAQIREDTLDKIIDQAQGVESLHRPLAMRPQLSIRAVKRIATFVASALIHTMIDQSDLNEDDGEEILERVRERIAGEQIGEEEDAALAETAREFMNRGVLNDKFIVSEVEDGHRELVMHCLALMADMSIQVVRKVIYSKSGRAVTALAWRAELKMRTAYELQTKLALVPSAQLLHGKNGDKYPIGDDELEWHLSYFLENE